MDSNSKRETPLQAADVYPKVSSSLYNSSGSSFYPMPIRAPPTIDSDSEDFLTNDAIKFSTSSYGSDCSEFLSGEDDFEPTLDKPRVVNKILEHDEYNDASRPFVKVPDDVVLEDSNFVEESAVSRPFVSYPGDEIVVEGSRVDVIDVSRPIVEKPDEEIFEKSSLVEEFGVSRPFVKTPSEEITEEAGNVDEINDSRPFVKNSDGEIVGKSSLVEPAVIDVENLPPPKLGMPIALLSGDSDDDSIGTEVDDDQFTGSVMALGAEVVENAIFAPKVKVLTIDEDGEDDSVSVEDVDGFLSSDEEKGDVENESNLGEDINGNLGTIEKKSTAGKDSVKESNTADLVENEGLEFHESAIPEYLVAGKDYQHVKFLAEDAQVFEDAKQENQLDDGNTVERTGVCFGDTCSVKMDSMAQIVQSNLCEMEIPEVDKDVDTGAVLLNNGSSEIHSDAFSAGVLCWQGIEDEKSHIEVELISEKGLDSRDSVIHDNILERVSLLNSESGSDLKVDDKDEADFPENLAEEVESSFLDDNDEGLIYGDSETIMQRSERAADPHDSLNYDIAPDLVSARDSNSLSEVKVDNIDDSVPEEVECSLFSNDTAEDLIFGDLETMTQLSEKAVDSHDTDINTDTLDPELKVDDESEEDHIPDMLTEEVEGSHLDDSSEELVFGDPKTMMQIIDELKQKFKHTLSHEESSHDDFQEVEGNVGESEGNEIGGSSALSAFLKAVAGSSGVSSTFPSVRPTSDATSPNLFPPSELSAWDEYESKEIVREEEVKNMEKIQQIRVKFLRLVQRLGLSAEDSTVAQVLRRLIFASGRLSSRSFSLESAIKAAMETEAEAKNELNFSLNILVIGKTGVGKSATINSVFGQAKALTNAFYPATATVKEIVGRIGGVEVRILDTPGLRSSVSDQSFNRRTLSSIKKFTKRCPPDVVLYVDRVDTQSHDLNDLPLLRVITSSLGPSVWCNSVIVLTHAASTPPDGLFGSPISFDVLVSQRSRAIQQMLSYVNGDLNTLIPIVPVENHPLCKKNGTGQLVLPDGQSWIPQLLLLCYSTKILSEANSVWKLQQSLDHSKIFKLPGRRGSHLLPLPYFVTSLLQSFAHPKVSPHQNDESVDSDIGLGCLADFDQEGEDEYDQLPPFKSLSKLQLSKLSKEQKKAYFDEFDYRVKLLKKKQWREDLRRLKEMEKKGREGADMEEDGDHENRGPADVAVPLPDMAIPLSFDGDNPSYRYRFLEPSSRLLTRPVLDAHGWDHDIGYDSVSLKQILEIANCFPAEVSVQMTKDKKEFNVNMDSAVSVKHGLKGSTMAGLDIQIMGEQLAYILKGETKLKSFKLNETAAGVSITFLGDNVVSGFKIEDQVAVGKRLVLAGSTGITLSQGDNAYGVKLEGHIRENDFPIEQDQSSLGLTLVQWRGDFIWVCNFQSEFSVGRSSKMCLNAGLNNKGNGKFSVRINSWEQLTVAILGLLPIVNTICMNIFPSSAKGNPNERRKTASGQR